MTGRRENEHQTAPSSLPGAPQPPCLGCQGKQGAEPFVPFSESTISTEGSLLLCTAEIQAASLSTAAEMTSITFSHNNRTFCFPPRGS